MSRVAAIDCGTNSIRLLIADAIEGRVLRDVHREMRIVRLGQGVDATGRLAPEAIERTGAALADYVALARRKGVERVRMVATSAVRDAVNQDDFFGMVRATLGTDAEVISGDEEARLSFTGAVGEFDGADGPFVVTDIGGGSTELVLGGIGPDGVRLDAACSVDIGCVRLRERCLRSDPPTAAEIADGRKLVLKNLGEAFAAVPVERARGWVGVAGTITTLSAVVQDLPGYDSERTHLSRLDLAQLAATVQRLLAMSHAEVAGIGSVHPGRVDVIGAGALIALVLAEELTRHAGISELVVSEHDILDGIAMSLL
jgi:exopolyphosphatase/guanosine-5'-triphosphate,3'-diphosphate pyrophosphatase